MRGTFIVITAVGVVLIILIVICRRRRPRCVPQDGVCPRDERPRASELDEMSGGAPRCNCNRDLMSFANHLVVVCRRRCPRCLPQDGLCPRREGPRASEVDGICGRAPRCNCSRDLMSFANQVAGGRVGCLHEQWRRQF